MAYSPLIPAVNAGVSYLNGLYLSNNATTPTTVLNVSAGAARNSSSSAVSTNVNDIILDSAVTISLAASGAGGIDTGTVAANTLYAVYVIGSSVDMENWSNPNPTYGVSALLSTSFTQPYLPKGYDMYRRIGAVGTDGSSQFRVFAQDANRRMWFTGLATSITAGNATSYTVVGLNAVASVVPIVAGVVAHLNVTFTPTTAGNKVFLQPAGADSSLNATSLSGDVAAVAHNDQLSCPIGILSSLANVSYKVTAGGDAVAVQIAGYTDAL